MVVDDELEGYELDYRGSAMVVLQQELPCVVRSGVRTYVRTYTCTGVAIARVWFLA